MIDISILTSGTLSANNSFSLMKHRLGIDNVSADKIAETSKKSPFNYKENALIYIPEYIPFPNVKREGYIKAITSEIDRLIKATYQRRIDRGRICEKTRSYRQ